MICCGFFKHYLYLRVGTNADFQAKNCTILAIKMILDKANEVLLIFLNFSVSNHFNKPLSSRI